jgi:hypothetical protein
MEMPFDQGRQLTAFGLGTSIWGKSTFRLYSIEGEAGPYPGTSCIIGATLL